MEHSHMSKLRSHPVGPRLRQAGFSLIELMIGITIGLLVMVAAVGSLVYTRISSTAVGDSSRLQQDASTAFRIIGHHIRQGGARRVEQAGGGTVEFNGAFFGFGSAAAGTVVVTGTDGAANAADTLQISNDRVAPVPVAPAVDPWPTMNRDCLGAPSRLANSVTNTFSLNAGNLFCVGSGADDGAALVQGVEDLQVWYGSRNILNDQLIYQASPVPGISNQIETVMVCLRMAGEATGNPGANSIGCIPGQDIADDGRIRRVFFRVFNIRNIGI